MSRGTLLPVQAGSAAERVAIGLGEGSAELKKAKDTAQEIAKQLQPRFQQQGWIP